MSEKKQIEEIRKDIFAAFGGYAKWEEDWQSLAEAVYNAGYRKQSEWISVEERLPQVTGKYICCVKDKRGNTWTVPADWNLEMKMWFGEFGEIKSMVTHWMPLPEPPKGD